MNGGSDNEEANYLVGFVAVAVAVGRIDRCAINVDFVCLPAGEITARIRAEASNPQVDVFLGGSSEMHDPLAKDGLLVRYDSPVAKEIDPKFHDPNGYWHGWYLGALGIVVNRERFKAEMPGLEYPKTWDDLLNPAYKGKFVTSNPSTAGGAYIFLVTQVFRLGEDKAFQFLKELDKNVSHYTPSAPAPIQLVATGQFVAGMSWGHDILRVQSQGYPIDLFSRTRASRGRDPESYQTTYHSSCPNRTGLGP